MTLLKLWLQEKERRGVNDDDPFVKSQSNNYVSDLEDVHKFDADEKEKRDDIGKARRYPLKNLSGCSDKQVENSPQQNSFSNKYL